MNGDGIEIDDAPGRIDFDRVTAWLAASYWSPGIARAKVEKGARHSTVVLGAYAGAQQVGFARVVSDTTRFAYVCDVVVDPDFRGRGIATRLMRTLIDHPLLADTEHWYLITMDAQPLYRALGFEDYRRPDRMLMSWSRPT